MANSSKPKGGAVRSGRIDPHMSRDNILSLVVMLLLTAIFAFAAGIFVDRIQQSHKTASNTSSSVERTPESKNAPEAKKESPRAERTQTVTTQGSTIKPNPVVLSGTEKGETNAQPSRTLTSKEPNTAITLPAPPSRDDARTPKPDTEKPASEQTPAAPSPAAPSPASPTETKVANAQPMATPAAPTPAAPATATPAPVPTTPEKSPDKPADKPTDKATAATGAFTVQVGSFDTMKNAEKYKKSVSSKSDFEVTLHPSKDGKVVKACIGNYPDKAAALKAREELVRIKDFKGCFVKAISEL